MAHYYTDSEGRLRTNPVWRRALCFVRDMFTPIEHLQARERAAEAEVARLKAELEAVDRKMKAEISKAE